MSIDTKSNFKGKFKRGWTLVELSMSMIILAILVGLSVQAIKPKRILIGPFAYAGMENIKQANNYILDKCTKGEVYGCSTKGNELPQTNESAVADMQVDIPGTTLATSEEVWCFEIANLFTLANNTINCKYHDGNGDDTKLPTGRGLSLTAGKPNFQASNMVAYYFLERPWKKINKSYALESSGDTYESSMNEVQETYYKQIFIDVNGDDDPNRLGEDQFPLRVYITGEIIPGMCNSNGGIYTQGDRNERVEDETYEDYCPTDQPAAGTNWMRSSYPFSYNLYRVLVGDGGNSNTTTGELYGVSYQEAACKSGRSILVPREYFCDGTQGRAGQGDVPSNLKDNESYAVIQHCKGRDSGQSEDDAFCVTRHAKPSNPGLFRLPIL